MRNIFSEENIMVLSFSLLPFTLLRVGPVGPGEIGLLILFIFKGVKFHKWDSSDIFLKFWLAYIGIISVSFCINYFTGYLTGSLSGALFDYASYIFVFLSLTYLYWYIVQKPNRLEKVAHKYIWITLLIFSTLYIISLRQDSLWGLSLKYYDYFVPLAKNLHQTAMVIVTLPFLSLFILRYNSNWILKFLLMFLSILCAEMALNAGSSKAEMAIYFGYPIVFTFSILSFFRKQKMRLIRVILITVPIIVGIYMYSEIEEFSKDYFVENDGGGARESFYNQALNVSVDSYFLGSGPGAHIYHGGKFWDVHQTFLASLLQGGAIGLIIFTVFIIKILLSVYRLPTLLAATTSILLYATGGDILRRLPIWIILFLIYHISIKLTNEENIVYS